MDNKAIDFKEKQHINSVTQDTDGNLVISINIFGVFHSLLRSVFGYIAILTFIGGIFAFYYGKICISMIAFFTVLVLVALAWLNANDNLKKRLFPLILREYINNKDSGKEFNPLRIQYLPGEDRIEVIDRNGDKYCFMVNHIMEKIPLYIVRIIIRTNNSE